MWRTASRCRPRRCPACSASPEAATPAPSCPRAAPRTAIQLPNDRRAPRFVGAVPPAGHGPHRIVITIHALDVEDIGVAADVTPAFLVFTMGFHTLARATLIATAETPAAEPA